jgi:agmatinase
MRNKKNIIEGFDPNGVGLKNGNFIGLPFDEQTAGIVLLPVPWDVTVSYRDGTATAANNILEASSQLDLFDADVKDAWKAGIYLRPIDEYWLKTSRTLRPKAQRYIQALETGKKTDTKVMQESLNAIHAASVSLKEWVYQQTDSLLEKGKIVGLIGGEHSIPLGYIEALTTRYEDIGILHIDAHLDLRQAYEGFTYSHASIFNNVLKINGVSKLVSVGIRDYCQEELDVVEASGKRCKVFFDHKIKEAMFVGITWAEICKKIVKALPKNVYISFDIDGLDPGLCPNTGTPVPGGLSYQEAVYLLRVLAESGKKIIGFDLCEVGGEGHEWDGNVAARILYKLCNFAWKSRKA